MQWKISPLWLLKNAIKTNCHIQDIENYNCNETKWHVVHISIAQQEMQVTVDHMWIAQQEMHVKWQVDHMSIAQQEMHVTWLHFNSSAGDVSEQVGF